MVTVEQVNRFVLRKQHLTGDSKTDDILRIAGDITGLHGTGVKEPYLAIFARTNNFLKEQLDRALYIEKALAKVRCMRGTLYILPREMVPIAHAATREMFEKLSRRYAEFRGISASHYDELSASIRGLLKGREMTIAQIKREMGTDAHLSAVLNLMCDQGLVARTGSGWHSKIYRYALFSDFYGIELEQYDEKTALTLLIRKYLSALGPATVDDIAWWVGVGKTKVKEALKSVKDLTSLEVDGLDGEFLLLRSDLSALMGTGSFDALEISLLPNLDPYLMGFKRRERYLGPEYYDTVFDRSGNVTSTVLLNGRIIGVWDCAEVMKIHLFQKVGGDIEHRIYTGARQLGRFITGKEMEVKPVASMTPLKQRNTGAFMSPLKGEVY